MRPMDSSHSTPDWTNTKTIVDLFFRRVDHCGDREALFFRSGESFVAVSWQTLGEEVRRTASMLVELGVQPGQHVIQISENRYEWILFDLAIQLCGAVHVPIHATLSANQIAFQIIDSGAQLVILSSATLYQEMRPLLDDCFHNIRWLFLDVLPQTSHSQNIYLRHELADRLAADRKSYEHQASENDAATILYTSGTTGEPKGVVLTHDNLISNTFGILTDNRQEPEDLRLSLLPWSHIFARTCDIYCWIASGCQLAIAENREKILDNCRELKPTLLNAVPYFFDKLYQTLADKDATETPGSLNQLLGGRIRVCCSGGAALPGHVEELFSHQNIALLSGYGLTETSPVITISTLKENRRGTVGKPLRDVEIRIAADGEILTRGPHIMKGYYNNPIATTEVIRDGWLHTGDLGTLSDDGYLTITGRKKEMIVLSTGKNVSPVNIELMLVDIPLILRAFVLGNDRSSLAALIVPNPKVLRGEIIHRSIAVSSPEEACSHPQIMELYRSALAERLKTLASHEQIHKFRLLDRDFNTEMGELTPTLKLRRDIIRKNFEVEISAMYAS